MYSRRKALDPRERRRIATRRERHGADFEKMNARRAGLMSTTKFTSETGKAAANKKWKAYRDNQAKAQEGGTQ